MISIRISLFSALLLVSLIHQYNGDDNESSLWESAGLTPDPIRTLPKTLAEVIFLNEVTIATGQPLNLSQVSSQPLTISYPWNSSEVYTFMMIDPDSPSREYAYNSQHLLWLSVNNPGESAVASTSNTQSGQDIVPYQGPIPVDDSGEHRYVIMVFKQSHLISDQPFNQIFKFSYLNYTFENQMGDPISGNFFVAQANNVSNEN